MTSYKIQSFLPRLRETSFPLSAEDEGLDTNTADISSSQQKRGSINRYDRASKDSTIEENFEESQTNSMVSGEDGVAKTASCMPRSELAQRMYETMARVQSNRRSRRARNLLQQSDQSQGQTQSGESNEIQNMGYNSLDGPVDSRSLYPSQSNKTTHVSEHRSSTNLHNHSRYESSYAPFLLRDFDDQNVENPTTYSSPMKILSVSESHATNYYEPIQRNAAGRLVFEDCASVDSNSIKTGYSQQELIRKKVRQKNRIVQKSKKNSFNNSRGVNSDSTTSKRRKKTTIVQIPTNLMLSSQQNVRYYVKARSRLDVDSTASRTDQRNYTIESDPSVLFNSKEITLSNDAQHTDRVLPVELNNIKNHAHSFNMTETTMQTTKDASDENTPPQRDSEYFDSDVHSLCSFPLLSRSAQNGGLHDKELHDDFSGVDTRDVMVATSSSATSIADHEMMVNTSLGGDDALKSSETTQQSHIVSNNNQVNPCETSFITVSTSSTTSTSLQSGNRVRFSESIVTVFDPEEVPDKCTDAPVVYTSSISKSTSDHEKLPWDERPSSNIGLSQCSRDLPNLTSILRKPKFGRQDGKVNRLNRSDPGNVNQGLLSENDNEVDIISPPTLTNLSWKLNDSLELSNTIEKVPNDYEGIQGIGNGVDTSLLSASTDTSFTVEYQRLSTSLETATLPSLEPASPERSSSFVDKQGKELSPIPTRNMSPIPINAVLMEEPVSHLAGHPAEKHWHETQMALGKSVPATEDRLTNVGMKESNVCSSTLSNAERVNLSTFLEEKNDDESGVQVLKKTLADDESTVTSAVDFIEAVAAIVVQTAVRRYQAQCIAKGLSESRCQRGDKNIDRPFDECKSAREIEVNSPKNLSIDETPDQSRHVTSDAFLLNLYEEAAVRIQAVFRSFWVRDSIEVDRYCAALIQKTYRGHVCKKLYTFDLRRIVLVQSWWRRNIVRDYADEILDYVVCLQSIIRRYLVRLRISQWVLVQNNVSASTLHEKESNDRYVEEHEAAAAIVIQSRWRVFVSEDRFVRSLVNILIVQTVVRRWLALRLAQQLRSSPNVCRLESSFQSHEEYCQDLESTLVSFETQIRTDFPHGRSGSQARSHQMINDRGLVNKFVSKTDGTIIRHGGVNTANGIGGQEVNRKPTAITRNSSHSLPFDESLPSEPQSQAVRLYSRQIPGTKTEAAKTRSKSIERPQEHFLFTKQRSQGHLSSRMIIDSTITVSKEKGIYDRILEMDNTLKPKSEIQNVVPRYDVALERSVANKVSSPESSTSGPLYDKAIQAHTGTSQSVRKPSKSYNSNSSAKSRRVEQFFQSSTPDTVTDTNIRIPNVDDNDDDAYRWKVEQAKLEAMLSKQIPNETFGDDDLTSTKNSISLWKEKVKSNPGKMKNVM